MSEAVDALHGVPAERLAEITGVDVTTARRWKRQGALPEPARRLLDLIIRGNLAIVSSDWCGWTLRGELLIGPDGISVRPPEVLAIPFVRAHTRSLQTKLRYATQADWVAGAWQEPGQNKAPDAEQRAQGAAAFDGGTNRYSRGG